MPIQNYPLTDLHPGVSSPILPVKLYNPANDNFFKSWAIVDTGASACAVPANLALVLGHKLDAVPPVHVNGAGGETGAYPHTTKIEIFHYSEPKKIVYTIDQTPINFTVGLGVILLGVQNFLSNFKLTVDYPGQFFSIQIKK